MSFFFLLSTKEDFLKNVSKQTVDSDFQKKKKNYCLVTNILQNIVFCVQQRKETCADLQQMDGE